MKHITGNWTYTIGGIPSCPICGKRDKIIGIDGAYECGRCDISPTKYVANMQARIAELEMILSENIVIEDGWIGRIEAGDERIVKLEAQLEREKWHRYPVEKPPKSGIEYLVLIDGEIPRLAVYGHHVLYEDDTMNKWYSDEGPAKEPAPYGETEITHWAELPSPPEDEK